MTFEQVMKQEFGYDCISTFWLDFSIADRFGEAAIKNTFNRAFEDWRTNYKYLTEFVLVLNCKCRQHYNAGRTELSSLYGDLFYKANDYARENLQGEELSYFFNVTD